ARLLGARIPDQRGTAIAHGDYRFGNCLVDCERGRISAVLDWELCTLGDPLADVGYLGVYWARDGVDQLRSNDPSGAPGFPTYEELVQRYATRSGRAVDGIGYYVAFSSWRLAVISEGVYARYLNGAMADQVADLDQMKQGTERLAESALSALRSLA
ncbi:MAG TPA: phosphotransferase, partial [Ilumatobacteraceae bacterium]